MDQAKALRMVETIVSTHLEMIGVECGPGASQAMREAVVDIQGLIREIFQDVADEARATADPVIDEVYRRNRDREILGPGA